MTVPQRRNACPGLAAPMLTGDGMLARLTPVGTLALDAFAGLCATARTHGNGVIEVSARGNIQIRGLTSTSAPAFAEAVGMLGIAGADGVPVIADPLAGLDPDATIDAGVAAAELRGVLATHPVAGMLGPKVSVVVDGGVALHLDALGADVRLRAVAMHDETRMHVAVGGNAATAAPVGFVASECAITTGIELLGVIAARGRDARARDLLRTYGAEIFRSAIADLLIEAPATPPRPSTEPIGTHHLRDGRYALGIGLAFGHSHASALGSLINAAKDAGASGIRVAPGRALLIVGVEPFMVVSLAAIAERLDFIVHASDPRRYLAACAGAPLCASAQIPTRTLGPAVARAAAPLLDGSLTIHLSGCAKGCAHHGAAALTIVGDHGGCSVIVDGAARDAPLGTIAIDALPSRLAALAQEIVRLRRPGESAAEICSRVGATRVSTILQEAGHG
jgi:precorrin-3B synthase